MASRKKKLHRRFLRRLAEKQIVFNLFRIRISSLKVLILWLVSVVSNSLAAKSKESPSPVPLSENQNYSSSMKLPPPWMLRVSILFSKLLMSLLVKGSKLWFASPIDSRRSRMLILLLWCRMVRLWSKAPTLISWPRMESTNNSSTDNSKDKIQVPEEKRKILIKLLKNEKNWKVNIGWIEND